MNTDELEYVLLKAERRVLEIQTKLHRWAGDDPHRRFDDLFNLVADPAFLMVAWFRVRGKQGRQDRWGGWAHCFRHQSGRRESRCSSTGFGLR